MKRSRPNTESVYDFPSTDEDPDNEIMVVEPDESSRRRPAPARAKNRKQRESDELDQKLIDSGLLSADELVGLSKEEKMQFLKAFQESMATGSTSQESVPATTIQPSPERADARSPEIFGSQAEFAEAEPSVLEPESELAEARPESDEVVPDSQTQPINLSDDDSLLTDDNDDDNGDDQVSSTTKTKERNITRNSQEAEATPEKLPTSSTNQRAAHNAPANRKVAYVSANPRAACSPAANQKAPQVPDSPLIARKKTVRGISYEDEDEATPHATTSANQKRAVEEVDQSEGPMFTFECKNDADWPRSPSPKKLSEKGRSEVPTLDACPLFTPPGYCPREYTEVIVHTFNEYLDKLYKYQCDTLPRRRRWEPVEVGRCHSGTLDLYRKRPHDLSEQLEQYYDWRHSGGEPAIVEPGENEAKHTIECDEHGTHSISASVEPFPEGPDSWQDDTPEMEIEIPEKGQRFDGIDRRKRKYEPEYGVLPDLDWDENEEPRTKRKAKAEDSDEDFVPDQKLPRTTRRNAKPSVDITSGYKDKMSQFSQALGGSEPVLQRHSRGGRRTPEMRGGGKNPGTKRTRKLLVDPKQTHLMMDSDDVQIEDFDEEFESIPRKKGARFKKSEIPDSFADFVDEDEELEPGEIPRGMGRGFLIDEDEVRRAREMGRRKQPEPERARSATPTEDVAEEETMNCPICSDLFPMDRIEDHASTCDGTSMAQLKQQQRSFTEEEGGVEPHPTTSGGHVPRPANTRSLRNNKTVEVHICMSCKEPINQDVLEAHLAQCLPKRDANFERRVRAKMMSEKALERQRSNPELLLQQALIDVKKQKKETPAEGLVLPKVATVERASGSSSLTPEKRWRIPLLTPERSGRVKQTPEKQQQKKTVTEEEHVLINVVNPQTSGVKQQAVKIARPEATEKCLYCGHPYPVSLLSHHYDLCRRRPRDRTVIMADSQDLNLQMSDHSQEEEDNVQSIEIHDSESSEDEPPPKRPNHGNHGNVQRPPADQPNRYHGNQARSHGSQSSNHGEDEVSLDTQNSEGWMGKEEGKEKAESGTKRGRLRRTKR